MIEAHGAKLMLQLASKKKTAFTGIRDVLAASDKVLFESIILSQDIERPN
jgi:hypothetical protein